MLLERFFAEPGADFADSLVLLSICVVACEQECTIYICALALSIVCIYGDKCTMLQGSDGSEMLG